MYCNYAMDFILVQVTIVGPPIRQIQIAINHVICDPHHSWRRRVGLTSYVVIIKKT